MAFFEPATPELLAMGEDLIVKYHEPLTTARMAFIFRNEAQRTQGRDILGGAIKVTTQMRLLAKLDFVIWVAKPDWEQLGQVGKRAVIDHQLCHCGLSADYDWAIRPHDVQEFTAVIRRWGLRTKDLIRLGEAVQEVLPNFEPEQPARGAGTVTTLDAATADGIMQESLGDVAREWAADIKAGKVALRGRVGGTAIELNADTPAEILERWAEGLAGQGIKLERVELAAPGQDLVAWPGRDGEAAPEGPAIAEERAEEQG